LNLKKYHTRHIHWPDAMLDPIGSKASWFHNSDAAPWHWYEEQSIRIPVWMEQNA